MHRQMVSGHAVIIVTTHPKVKLWTLIQISGIHKCHFREPDIQMSRSNLTGVRGHKDRRRIALLKLWHFHHHDVIMSAPASQIAGVTSVYSTVCLSADQRKHQSSASLAFMRGIHRWPVNSPHKGPVTRKCFHLMTSSCLIMKMHVINGACRTSAVQAPVPLTIFRSN